MFIRSSFLSITFIHLNLKLMHLFIYLFDKLNNLQQAMEDLNFRCFSWKHIKVTIDINITKFNENFIFALKTMKNIHCDDNTQNTYIFSKEILHPFVWEKCVWHSHSKQSIYLGPHFILLIAQLFFVHLVLYNSLKIYCIFILFLY